MWTSLIIVVTQCEPDYRASVAEMCVHRTFAHQSLMRNGAADYKGSVSTAASKASTTLDIARLDADNIHDFTSSTKGVDYQHRKPD